MDSVTTSLQGMISRTCTIHYVEIMLVSLMILIVISLVILRLAWKRTKNDGETILGGGIGIRLIQFLAVGLLIPSIVILALEGFLDKSVLGTLLGTIIGYVLSNIGDESKAKD